MAGLIAALAVVTTAGCASGAAAEKAPSAGPEKPNLVIAAVPTASSAGVYVAQQDGLFRRAGLNVKIVNISAGANVTPELRSGRIDVVNGAYAGFIQAQVHQAAQFHILADGYAGAPNVDEVVVLPASGISSAKQLEGKTIAVNALGSVAQLLVSSALAAQGVPASRVHFVAVGFPAMSAALKAHHIDAAYLPEPYLARPRSRPAARTCSTSTRAPPRTSRSTVSPPPCQWCRKYPKTAAAVARALDEGQALADTDRPLVQKALARYTTITKQIAAIMSLGNFPATVDTVHLQRVPDLMQSFGLLKQHFSISVMTRPTGS